MANYKPLAGVKVIELSFMMAGPSCCRYLADWARRHKGRKEVRRHLPLLSAHHGYACDPGLQPALRRPERRKALHLPRHNQARGMEALHKLLATADVFVTNNRQKALDKNGLDYDTLKEKYPGLIMPRSPPTAARAPGATTPARTPSPSGSAPASMQT